MRVPADPAEGLAPEGEIQTRLSVRQQDRRWLRADLPIFLSCMAAEPLRITRIINCQKLNMMPRKAGA